MAANAVTVVAIAYAGRNASGRRGVGVAAAALFAAWPLLTRPLTGPSAWENGQWNVDVGLHLYTEPLSTALVAVALALLLTPQLDELRLALAGLSSASRPGEGLERLFGRLPGARRVRLGPRRDLPLAAAGAAFAPLVAAYWPKGYPEIPNVPGFSLDQADRSWSTRSLDPRTLLVLLPLALVGLFALRPWASGLLGASIATNAVFYTFYEHTHLHPRFLYASLPALFVLESAGAHRVWRSFRRVRIGTATALLALLALGSGGGSARAVVDAPAPSAAGWEIRAAPFRLLFRDGTGKPTAEQIRERGRGPGSSMGYDLQDGTSHRLTNLRSSAPVLGGRRYVVGTDEPARTATVIVQRTSRGLRVAWTLEPAAGVARVYESFAARDGEHFLGAGQQGASVDLRGEPSSSRSPTAATGRSSRRSTSRRPATAFSTGRARSVTCSSRARTTARVLTWHPRRHARLPDCGQAGPDPGVLQGPRSHLRGLRGLP